MGGRFSANTFAPNAFAFVRSGIYFFKKRGRSLTQMLLLRSVGYALPIKVAVIAADFYENGVARRYIAFAFFYKRESFFGYKAEAREVFKRDVGSSRKGSYIRRAACVAPCFGKHNSFSDGVSENTKFQIFHLFTSFICVKVKHKPRCYIYLQRCQMTVTVFFPFLFSVL